MIHLIWAEDDAGGIGYWNKLPWRMPADLQHFKQKTQGHTVVMGRKTFESLNGKPLPKRDNVILTHNVAYQATDCTVIHTIEPVLEWAETQDIYIIGGRAVYELFLPHADVLHRTRIGGIFETDTVFPEVDWKQWKQKELFLGKTDAFNAYPYAFETYYRKNG